MHYNVIFNAHKAHFSMYLCVPILFVITYDVFIQEYICKHNFWCLIKILITYAYTRAPYHSLYNIRKMKYAFQNNLCWCDTRNLISHLNPFCLSSFLLHNYKINKKNPLLLLQLQLQLYVVAFWTFEMVFSKISFTRWNSL